MEFRQIQYFIKLSESTSISQAAKELFISQQALSKSIKNLESELNTRLFLRTNQGIKLSKSGVYLKNKFLSVCAGYEEAVLPRVVKDVRAASSRRAFRKN